MADLNWCTYCDNAINAFSDSLYCGEQCLRADALRNHPLLGYTYQEFVDFPRPHNVSSSSSTSSSSSAKRRPPISSTASSTTTNSCISLSSSPTMTSSNATSLASSLATPSLSEIEQHHHHHHTFLAPPPKLDLYQTTSNDTGRTVSLNYQRHMKSARC